MASKQCVLYKASQFDNEEAEGSMPLCFAINSNTELKDIPTNGEEYLLKVIEERKNYSPIMISTNDYSQFAQNQSIFVEEIKHETAPEFLSPTKEWQNLQVADFSDIRMYISRLQAKKNLWPRNVTVIDFDENDISLWEKFFEYYEPTLTCILGLKNTLVNKGLECLIKKLDGLEPGQTIDYKTGQWIYAFLARASQPLLSETASILRTLARKCAEIRSHFDEEDENATINVIPLNLFICLISRYFAQLDLADPYPPKTFVLE